MAGGGISRAQDRGQVKNRPPRERESSRGRHGEVPIRGTLSTRASCPRRSPKGRTHACSRSWRRSGTSVRSLLRSGASSRTGVTGCRAESVARPSRPTSSTSSSRRSRFLRTTRRLRAGTESSERGSWQARPVRRWADRRGRTGQRADPRLRRRQGLRPVQARRRRELMRAPRLSDESSAPRATHASRASRFAKAVRTRPIARRGLYTSPRLLGPVSSGRSATLA